MYITVYRVEQIDWEIVNTPVSYIHDTSATDFNERYVEGLRDWYYNGGSDILSENPTITSASYIAYGLYTHELNLPELTDFDYPEGV